MSELRTLEDIKTAAEISNSYMITLTTLEGGVFNHHLLRNNFPTLEMLRCHAEVEKLIIDELKQPPVGAPEGEGK